jgi:branched-chain amino acid transport system ATP-binding protein
MTVPVLSIEALNVSYGATSALRSVSLTVAAGQAVALLGANGAGKSSLIKSIIGLVRPTSGRILFNEQDLSRLPANRRSRLGIGYCPEGRRVFPGLTVHENLSIACWSSTRARARRIANMLALFPALADRQSSLAWQLSGGQQQMLAIARALVDAPRLLLLDEPSLGLSPRLTEEVFSRIPIIVAGGTAVLLAEQNVAKALQICSHAVVLTLGEISTEGPSAALAQTDIIRAAFLGG